MENSEINKIVQNYRNMSPKKLEDRAERHRREGIQTEIHPRFLDCKVRFFNDIVDHPFYAVSLVREFAKFPKLQFGNRIQIKTMQCLDAILIAYNLRYDSRGREEYNSDIANRFWNEFYETMGEYS